MEPEPESEQEKPTKSTPPHELPTNPKQQSPNKKKEKKEKKNDSKSSSTTPKPLTSLFTGWVANTINNVAASASSSLLDRLPGAWVSVVDDDGGSDDGYDGGGKEKEGEEEINGGAWTPNPTPADEYKWGNWE